MLKSLRARGAPIAAGEVQLAQLSGRATPVAPASARLAALPAFSQRLRASGLWPLRPAAIEIFQINLGKLCNQACRHCHVDAGPDRREVMTRETLELCLELIRRHRFPTVDLTGGAPEMNPHFRWFVESVAGLEHRPRVIDRCNLTILLANERYRDLPEFFARHRVNVVSSLPFYDRRPTDRQRGDGVFERSIEALRRLNAVGYGAEGSGLELDLVYNPAGAFLPAPQASLEADFKRELEARFGIRFNRLFTITNLPISRYLEYLLESGNLEDYLEKLVGAYNPAAASAVMCRNTLSVGWDGSLHDCDFNQMLDLGLEAGAPAHLRDFDLARLNARAIRVDQHCYGCTAGAGSSCGGATVAP